jgi:hypothetical protein
MVCHACKEKEFLFCFGTKYKVRVNKNKKPPAGWLEAFDCIGF